MCVSVRHMSATKYLRQISVIISPMDSERDGNPLETASEEDEWQKLGA